MAININGGLSVPGAHLIDYGGGSYPIYCSLTKYSTYGFGDTDDEYWVLPGYKLIVYAGSGYASPEQIFDNTYGKYIMRYTCTANSGDSCRLYYLNNEITVPGWS
jgi:hypothetical protein